MLTDRSPRPSVSRPPPPALLTWTRRRHVQQCPLPLWFAEVTSTLCTHLMCASGAALGTWFLTEAQLVCDAELISGAQQRFSYTYAPFHVAFHCRLLQDGD